MPQKQAELNFEASIKELETLVNKMEEGNLSLEDSLKYFERGVTLTRQCQQALADAEQKVKILLEKEGKAGLQDFEPEDPPE
ncbi:MAG: exodeoxyribonuclease VII small subunit [Gammaproteobacteria bacterium]|nr:exodeoxyribonuclease VII small subunit [Gammaproteobacteria bacterium]NIN61568.1 exodeoxyribonuclease VII small subunit [Gammaproteobacteria bacterium]NIO62762.1 exodeoxyribonuclease VII small subunit [Gammaproteobacteria bacterium]NIQ09599.1 exodeoxyribonuclease VII small subunit [Gammaproteobacteria bacterium]NIQ19326.1 exodeoxyribonuclease VII small subunit [Gammaproteobacteria bacterium]